MVNKNAGYLLNKRYRLIDLIGEGGMANVYLGVDTILNRKVAVKVLRGDLSHDETFVKRFKREALATTALEHPNLVQIYDVGVEQGYYYIVMEYIEGKTLKQLIKQHGPLSVGETIDVMEQLVSAVEHAHSRNVIHRDIKPQNVIVRNDGTVKLTDFGIAIAQNAAQLTETNSIMGSVHYLAPELAKGDAASEQSDIYSLGILMFELLAGFVPFTGDSAVNIALMHMEDRIPSIRGVAGEEVNQAIENIILRSTAKNKSNRYLSANDMLLDLVDCQYRNEAILELEEDEIESYNPTTEETIVMDKDKINKGMKKNNKKKFIIPIVIAAVLALGLLIYFLIPKGPKMTNISMPDIVNATKEDATKTLNDLKITSNDGFKIEYIEKEDADVSEGHVISTDPAAGVKLQEKSTITIYISAGVKIKVPDVVGESSDNAKKILTEAGFKVNITSSTTSDTSKIGKVLSVKPSANEMVQKGSTITIEVGVKEEITVQNVMNLTYKSAYEALVAQGLIVSTSNCSETYKVISQSKAPGSKVAKGENIELKCEITKTETPTTPPATTTPDATPNN